MIDFKPLTSAVAAAPEPTSELIVTCGGYSKRYPEPIALDDILVRVPVSLTRANPIAPLPNEGIGASIECIDKKRPFRGASLNMNWFLSTK